MATIPRGMRPIVSNYAIGAPSGVVETEVEGGLPRTALAFDRGPQTFTVSLFLTALGFSVWSTFFAHTIKNGAISFEMDLDSGYGVAAHNVTMVPGTYQAVPSGGIHRIVTFQVRAESQAYQLSASEAASLLALYEEYGESADVLLARIAQFANVDTLALDF